MVIIERVDLRCPRTKNLRDLNQALLLFHLVVYGVPEARCSRIAELQEDDVVDHERV